MTRQAVTDYIRHNFGQTPLNQLSPEQLKTILALREVGIPPTTAARGDRPSFITGGAQCAKTAGDQTCGGNGGTRQNRIYRQWRILELSGVKDGELIPAKLF